MIHIFMHLRVDSPLCQLLGLSQSASLCALHKNSYTGVIKALYSHCYANFVLIIDFKRNYAEQKNTQLILYVKQSMFMQGLCFK